jgi:tRNA pseudouridine55 synthase
VTVLTDGEIWLVDKPLDWTSFDVVAKIRNTYHHAGAKCKVGHAGTLDPKATGLLIIAAGKKTKEISSFEVLEKEYTGCIKLGAKTKSYDTETEEYDLCAVSHIIKTDIEIAAKGFLGKHEQQPPMFSATQVGGKRLYELARQGKDLPERKTKSIEIFELEITQIALPDVAFRALVSKGTYIRTIASDLGEKLGVGGYLKSLHRTKVGKFRIEEAKTVSAVVEEIKSRSLNSAQ